MPQDPFYSTPKWRRTRREHLDMSPLCCVCAALRLRTDATDVDHVVAKEKVIDPFDHGNLRSLCKMHHSQKTSAVERGKRGFYITGEDGKPVPYHVGEKNERT
jgi:5-methylcytosine-specific restriction endonuclease McrA